MIKILEDEKYYPALISHIQNARHSVSCTVFSCRMKNSTGLCLVRNIWNEIIEKNKQRITIIPIFSVKSATTSIKKGNLGTIAYLRKNHIPCWIYDRYRSLHAKIFLIDNRFCIMGSHNLTNKSLSVSKETSILTDENNIIEEANKYFTQVYMESKQAW